MTTPAQYLITMVCGSALLAAAEPVRAQIPRLTEGQRVRVTAPAAGLSRRAAVVRSVRAGTLRVRVSDYHFVVSANDERTFIPDSVDLSVPMDSVLALDVSSGRQDLSRPFAAIGALAGVAIGYSLAQAGVDRCKARNGWFCGDFGEAPFGGLLGGAALGALGFAIGGAISTETWEPVALARVRPAVVAQPGGRLGLGATIVF